MSFSDEEISRIKEFLKNDSVEFYHDEPDKETDLFEFKRISNDIVNIVTKQKDTPFSILIHGEWGSGKTSLLHRVNDLLEKKKTNEQSVIWFDAWAYERFDAVAGLLQLIQKKYTIDVSNKFKETAKNIALVLFDAAVRTNINMSLDDMKSYFESSIDGIKTINNELEKLLSDNKRLIIIVDDLDRCSFETMLEIIEAIKIFLNSRGIIFIIAADNKKLQLAWNYKYSSLNSDEGKEYFDKFFQLKYALPPKIHIHVSEYLEKINSFLPTKFNEYLNYVDNPRKIKQILNKIYFTLKYEDFISDDMSDQELTDALQIITIWSIITISYPKLAKIISNNPLSFFYILVKFSQLGSNYLNDFESYEQIRKKDDFGSTKFGNLLPSFKNCLDIIIYDKRLYDFVFL